MKFYKLYILIFSSLLLMSCNQQMMSSAPLPVSKLMHQRVVAAHQQSFYSTAILKVPESIELTQAFSALKTLQELTLKESGNLAFIVQVVKGNPRTVLIWVQFRNQAAFQEHLQSEHMQAFLKLNVVEFVQGLSANRPEAPLSSVSSGYFSTVILTLEDSQNLDRASKAFSLLESKTRQEVGNLSFVVQKVKDSQTFIIWEHFKDKAAFEKHLSSTHLKTFLALSLVKLEIAYSTQPIK